MLQWGRVLTNTEVFWCAAGTYGAGTLQWGRVLTNTEVRRHSSDPGEHSCFNGAAFLRTRKWRGGRQSPSQPGASMGPRSYEHGSIPLELDAIALMGASMGPRSYEHGSVDTEVATIDRPRASMGPRSYEHGSVVVAAIYSAWMWELQWGRVLTNTEVGLATPPSSTNVSLQWGRVLTNTEV